MKQIDNELYKEVLEALEKRNKRLYKKMLELNDVDKNGLKKARAKKSDRKMDEIKKAILKISKEEHSQPSKYQVHKLTNIAYVTINKYYDEIVDNLH